MSNSQALKQNIRIYDTIVEFIKENLSGVTDFDEYIDRCSRRRLIDMYLSWEGIIGYTDTIITLINLLFPDVYEVDFDTKVDGAY